jgi:hypothetical protein
MVSRQYRGLSLFLILTIAFAALGYTFQAAAGRMVHSASQHHVVAHLTHNQATYTSPLSENGQMGGCYGEANCDGWVFHFTHPLEEEATITVYADLDGSYVIVGEGTAGPSDTPVTVSGSWNQSLPLDEVEIRFEVVYLGQTYYDTTTKPSCPPPPSNCTYTQGYWKNHPEDWPVMQLTLGGVTYSQSELLDILDTPPQGDATYILAHQLIAAKLNVANGADDSAVADTIGNADAWLVANPLGSGPGGSARDEGIGYSDTLAAYNEGVIGPGHCDQNGTLATNHYSGAVGSYFTFTGAGFPSSSTISVYVNGYYLGQLTADDEGSLTFLLRTESAGIGMYLLTAIAGNYVVNGSQILGASQIAIAPDGLAYSQDGDGQIFDLPPGLGFNNLA